MILGRTEILHETARLLAASHDVVLIVTAPAAPEYRKTEDDFSNLAMALGCECLVRRRIDDDVVAAVRRAKPDIVVSMNWVSVLDRRLFDLVPGGILNAHFGDLPNYRGNAVVNWAIIRNEPSIAFTVHFMVPGELDSGTIAAQQIVPLTPSTTIGEVLALAEQRLPSLFVSAIAAAKGERTNLRDSNGAAGFRCYPRLPVYSKIDWASSAREIDALVRASGPPFLGAFTYQDVEGRLVRVTIWESRLVSESTNDVGVPGHIIRNDRESGESWVLTGQGVIALLKVQSDDGPAFAPGTVWRSIRSRLGVDLEAIVLHLQNRLEP